MASADQGGEQQLDELRAEVDAARASAAAHPFVGPKRTLARALARYGVVLGTRGRWAEARDAHLEAETLLEEAVDVLGDRKDEELLARIASLLALTYDRLGDVDTAGRALATATNRRRVLATGHPDDATATARLVTSLTALARHERLNAPGTSPPPALLEAVMLGREALTGPAASVEGRHALAGALDELADATTADGDLAATFESRLEAVRVLQPAADHLGATTRDRIACATALHDLAKVAMWSGDLIAAREASDEAVERLDWFDVGDDTLAVLRPLGLALGVMGQIATEQGRFDDAEAAFARAEAVADRVRRRDEPLAQALDAMLSGDRLRLAGRRRDVAGIVRGMWRAVARLRRFERALPDHVGATYRNQLNRALFGRADPTGWSAVVHSGRMFGRLLGRVAVFALQGLPFRVPGVPPRQARPAGVPEDASSLEG